MTISSNADDLTILVSTVVDDKVHEIIFACWLVYAHGWCGSFASIVDAV